MRLTFGALAYHRCTLRRVFPFVLTVLLGCLTLGKAQSADKRLTLALEAAATLRLGELAVLEIPSDRRNSDSKINGAWSDVLTRIGRSGRKVYMVSAFTRRERD